MKNFIVYGLVCGPIAGLIGGLLAQTEDGFHSPAARAAAASGPKYPRETEVAKEYAETLTDRVPYTATVRDYDPVRRSSSLRAVTKYRPEPAKVEHTLPDLSRVDILTRSHAYEVEWAESWEQAIGQSLKYAAATNRKPGIVLLMRAPNNNEAQRRDWIWCGRICDDVGIELRVHWVEPLED